MGITDSLQLTKLLEKLSVFGLNPQEWDLADQGHGFFTTLLLVHRQDPQFRLLGTINQKGWQKLEVLSI